MNNNYYQGDLFPNDSSNEITPNQFLASTSSSIREQDITFILSRNIGKFAKFYMTYSGSKEWPSKMFEGIIEAASRDHVIISDPKTGIWRLLVLIYLDFIDFDEAINLPKK